MLLLLLWFFSIIPSGNCLTCLSCSSVISPRHCQNVLACNKNEVCAVEKFRNSYNEEMYNVGCRAINHCNSILRTTEHKFTTERGNKTVRSIPIICTECCYRDLCNAAGCGEQGFPKTRGPACYNCIQFRIASKCDIVDVCAIDEVCHVQLNEQFGERFFSTSCVSQHVCHAINGNAIFGKRHSERSSLRMVCEKCCSNDLCNSNCGGNEMTSSISTAVTTDNKLTTTTTTVTKPS